MIFVAVSTSVMSSATSTQKLVADGLKMILGMTLAIGSRRLQMFSVLPPLALMLSYVSPPPATASAAPSAAGSASRPIDSKLRKVARPTSSIGLRSLAHVVAMSRSVASAKTVRPMVRMPVISAPNSTSSCGAILSG